MSPEAVATLIDSLEARGYRITVVRERQAGAHAATGALERRTFTYGSRFGQACAEGVVVRLAQPDILSGTRRTVSPNSDPEPP